MTKWEISVWEGLGEENFPLIVAGFGPKREEQAYE